MAVFPTISIVTATLNQAPFLEEAICSVLDQSYPPFEYIIIDGGSTDGSVEIINKYHHRITYWVSEPDKGQSHALNKGFRRTTGDIVAWLNSDDMYPEGTFEAIAAEFRKDPQLDIVYGNKAFVDENGFQFDELKYTRIWYPMLIAIGSVLPQPAAFWKRSLFDRVGYLDESFRFSMDREFMCRAAKVARRKHIRRATCLFRWQPHQKSQTLAQVGREEGEIIKTRYGSAAFGKWPPFLMKPLCHIARAILFLLDGEIGYLVRGLARRIGTSA